MGDQISICADACSPPRSLRLPLPAKHCWQHVASLIPPGKGETGPPPPHPGPLPALPRHPPNSNQVLFLQPPTKQRRMPGLNGGKTGLRGEIPRALELLHCCPRQGGTPRPIPIHPSGPREGKGQQLPAAGPCLSQRWGPRHEGHGRARNSSCEASTTWLAPGRGHRVHVTSRCPGVPCCRPSPPGSLLAPKPTRNCSVPRVSLSPTKPKGRQRRLNI